MLKVIIVFAFVWGLFLFIFILGVCFIVEVFRGLGLFFLESFRRSACLSEVLFIWLLGVFFVDVLVAFSLNVYL